jgi:putative transposase
MSRPLRIEFKNAWYHVMNRGASRGCIFKTDDHRNYFLELLADTSERFNADWHAYCLMDNHYHLMLHTPEGNLQRIMRHLNGVYTQYYNRSEGTDGALFRGRYKAILVDAQTYWLHLSRYIHRNPLEAGIVSDLGEYIWSSYNAYTKKRSNPVWLSTHYVLQSFGQKNRRLAYKRFVAAGIDEETAAFYSGGKHSPVRGDEDFCQAVLKGRVTNIDVPELRQMRSLPSIEQIVLLTANHYGVAEDQLRRSTRGRGVKSPARSVAMYLCQEVASKSLSEIAAGFNLASYASAGSSIRSVRLKLTEDPRINDSVRLIKLDLTR